MDRTRLAKTTYLLDKDLNSLRQIISVLNSFPDELNLNERQLNGSTRNFFLERNRMDPGALYYASIFLYR